jgi:signal transduction histidine kinase
MTRPRKKSVTMLVWGLVMVGLVAMVVTNSIVGWTISDLNQERQRLMQLDSQLAETSQQLRRLNQLAQNRVRDLLQLDPVVPIKDFPNKDFAQLLEHFQLTDSSPEMSGIVNSMGRATDRLQQLWKQAADWRSRQQQLVADQQQKRTLNRVRTHLNRLRDSLESLSGQQRLTDALLIRQWRKAAGKTASKYAETLLDRQSRLLKRILAETNIELMDLARMVETLTGENQLGQLTDLKDNQLKPNLERIEQLLTLLYSEQLLSPDLLPPTVLEQLKESLFGQGYAIYNEYQTIRPGQGGLYQLARNRLLLLQEREMLLTRINSAFVKLESIFPDLTDLTRQRSRALADQAAASLGHSSSNMLLLSIVTLCGFLSLGWLFANIARKQVTELEERDQELHELNRNLEEKVSERTTLLEEKSLQLISTQEELLRQEKLAAIGSLAAGVAHEINNPAAIIRGNVEILQLDLPCDAPAREELAEIMQQVERVSLITQNMLSFAGRRELHHEPVQLNELIREILAQIGHQTSLGAVRIEYDLAVDLPAVPGDRERLRQVFNNIILNALQAMNGSGLLLLRSHEIEMGVEMIISDTGPGIPRPQIEKIFNPFYTTKKQGTGLGLSVSYGIVQTHEGVIEIDSIPSQGTSFRVQLPTLIKAENG